MAKIIAWLSYDIYDVYDMMISVYNSNTEKYDEFSSIQIYLT